MYLWSFLNIYSGVGFIFNVTYVFCDACALGYKFRK